MNHFILIASMNRQFAGGERYVTILAKALNLAGWKPSFFGEWLKQFTSCDFAAVDLASSSLRVNTPFPPAEILILNGLRPLYKYCISRVLGGPRSQFVVYIHHSDARDPHRGRVIASLRPLLMMFALAAVDVTVAINHEPLGFAFKGRAVKVILNAIDVDDHDMVPLRGGSQLQLLCVGSLTQRKNFQLALRAVAQVPEAVLTIVGDGPERQALIALAGRLGLRDRVNFSGHCDDVTPYYSSADVLLMPSKQEAFGLVALEAMASGVPVISTPTAGGREIVGESGAGILLRTFDVEEMAGAIRKLLMPEVRLLLAEQSRRRVVDAFSLSRFSAQWRDLLETRQA